MAQASRPARAQKDKKKPTKVADSWDDESSDESDKDNKDDKTDTKLSKDVASLSISKEPQDSNTASRSGDESATAKPPETFADYENPYLDSSPSSRGGAAKGASARRQQQDAPERRPEKTTAAAQRMIASAIGVRVKRTDEQRAYQQAQIDNVKRKREEEKRKKEEDEKAKLAVWED